MVERGVGLQARPHAVHTCRALHAWSPSPRQPPLLQRTPDMSVPARRRACPHPTRGHRADTDRTGRAAQRTGRLLCWSLAAGMAGAATETLLHPETGWWTSRRESGSRPPDPQARRACRSRSHGTGSYVTAVLGSRQRPRARLPLRLRRTTGSSAAWCPPTRRRTGSRPRRPAAQAAVARTNRCGDSGSAFCSGLSRIRANSSGGRAASWARTSPTRASFTRDARSASCSVSYSPHSLTWSRKASRRSVMGALPRPVQAVHGVRRAESRGEIRGPPSAPSAGVSRRSPCGRSRRRWRSCGAWRARRSGCAG
ncbi:hypothetical protein SPARM206S_00405 [Streptomyces parvulus]